MEKKNAEEMNLNEETRLTAGTEEVEAQMGCRCPFCGNFLTKPADQSNQTRLVCSVCNESFSVQF